MKASQFIKESIRAHEGFRADAYVCPGGVLTIGFGHTGSDVKAGQHIDMAVALALLDADIAEVEHALLVALAADGIRLSRQGQFDALLSFAFNLGINALRGSTLWRKIKADANDPTIPGEFARWIYAGGQRMPGLVKRRAEEAEIWQK